MDKQAFKAIADKSKQVALVFRALNNTLRQRLLVYLLKVPYSNVTTLYCKLRTEQATCSSHLQILRKEHLVAATREGNAYSTL